MSDREAIIRKLTDEYYEAIEVDSDVCSQRLYAAIETAYTLAGIDVLPTSRLDTEPAQ